MNASLSNEHRRRPPPTRTALASTDTRPPTVGDVASRAGVSKSTAARALADGHYVSPEVLKRVRAAAGELGYLPNMTARSLRAGTRREVGVLVTNLRDHFYSELASGIESTLSAAGYSMILANDEADEHKEIAAAETFASLRVPGVIITAVSKTAIRILQQSGIPVVQADRVVDDGTDSVLSANEKGAQVAIDLLLDAGHRRIALFIDEVNWTTGAGRLTGYRAAHAARGTHIDESLIVFVPAGLVPARQAVGQLLQSRPDVTAILAANSLLAEAVFVELRSRGCVLPQQMSVVAYDDVPWMAMVTPSMTTVSQHADEIGRSSAELLLRRLEEKYRPPVTLRVTPTLVQRESVHTLDE